MGVFKYEVINNRIDRKKPFVDAKGFFIIPNIKTSYKYYLEVRRYNEQTLNYEYFLLFGFIKFDDNCRNCKLDDYCRFKLRLSKDLKEYVHNYFKDNGNVNIEYLESENNYDVWQIG